MENRKLLVIGAHSADFVWRAAGTIALVTSQGGSADVIALSYGERGESGELWKEPGQTVENVKQVRHAEAEKAAAVVGASFRCLDLGDYPLNITQESMDLLVGLFQEIQPNILFTHTPAALLPAYEKWFIQALRERFGLWGTPLRLVLRKS